MTLVPPAALAAQLQIFDAKPDAGLTRVVITGESLATTPPTVRLGGQTLTLVPPVTSTRIEAILPLGIASGSYKLLVSTGNGATQQDSLAVAFAGALAGAGRWRVVDSQGNFFGYWADAGFSMVGDVQGYAAREIGGKWVGMNFTRNQISGGGGFYHTSADCTGPGLLPVDDYASGAFMSYNWTNAGTFAYSYPDTGTLQTIQSISTYNIDGTPDGCIGVGSLDMTAAPPGGSIDLGTLTPPFTIGMP